MTDDRSRILGLTRGDTTIVSGDRRIQVRMSSGKIYGPYSRKEILSFIQEGRIKGEESILVEGESTWRPISSDTEFFDHLQEVLLGISTPNPKAVVPAKVVVPSKSAPKSEDDRTQIVGEKAKKKPAKAKAPEPAPPVNETVTFQNPTPVAGPAVAPVPPENIAVPKTPPKSKKTLGLVAGAAAVVLALVWVAGQGGDENVASGGGGLGASSGVLYFRPMENLIGTEGFKLPTPPPQLHNVPAWPLPEGEGLQHWLPDLREALAEEDPKILGLSSHWGRIAWDALWISSVLEARAPGEAQALRQSSRVLLDDLKTRGFVSPARLALFKGAEDIIEGRFGEAVASLTAAGDAPIARALADEAAWLHWVSEGGRGAFRSLVGEAELGSLLLDLTAKTRALFSAKPADVGPWLVQLSYEDPSSYQLWFLSALANVKFGRVQNAQRFYVAGLATLGLYPRSIQATFWENYEGFLNSFARQETMDRAAGNRKALQEASISARNWWDFDQEGLSATGVLQEVLQRGDKGNLNSSDLALLEVLGRVVPDGTRALLTAADHWAFDANFAKAREVYAEITKRDPKNARGWGGLVWANARLYRFDEALDALDAIAQAKSSTPEDLKYSGVLHSIARDPDKATADFQAYLKQVPQDGWGHYFFARHWLEQGKNVECLKSSTLAFNHATEELRVRAQVLLFHCSILAGIDGKKSLAELKTLSESDPSAIHLRLAYIDGLVAMDLLSDAITYTRDAVQTFPKSYELRVKLGDLYVKQRNLDSAVAFYSRAGRDRPRAAEGQVKIAKIFEEQKRYLEAAQSYENAGRVEPGYPEIWLLAARAFEKAGRVEEAAAMYRREISDRPAVIGSFLEAAEFLLKINAPQEVPKLFQKFSSDFQGDPRVMTRLSQAYLAVKDLGNARSYAASAIKANPKIPEPYYVLGVVFEEESQFAEAKKYYETYLQLLPGAPDSAVLRGKISRPPFME